MQRPNDTRVRACIGYVCRHGVSGIHRRRVQFFRVVGAMHPKLNTDQHCSYGRACLRVCGDLTRRGTSSLAGHTSYFAVLNLPKISNNRMT